MADHQVAPAAQSEARVAAAAPEIVTIGANCILDLGGNQVFLLVEIEASVPGVEIDPLIFIRITREQARRLEVAGEPVCQLSEIIPEPRPGQMVEFSCILITDDVAFMVFDVENTTDIGVLVPISIEEARDLVRTGVRACTVIERPFL